MQRVILMLVLLALGSLTQIQAQEYSEANEQNLNAMSIPSSPAFSVLGVNPELVTRPNDVKEFKVDWRIKNYKLAPDLAIEGQPLWWIKYRNKTPEQMQAMSNIERILSTTSVSLATAKIDNANHLAWALKFNVYKQYDPFRDKSLIESRESTLADTLAQIVKEIEQLEIKRFEVTDQDTLKAITNEIKQKIKRQKDAIRENMSNYVTAYNEFIKNNWNMDMVDVAIGRVYKYDNAAIDSLNFQSAGYSLWVNASKGVGNHSLWTGILKMNKIGSNTNYMLGASYRFGNDKFNFFTELVRTKMNNVPENGFDQEEEFAGLRAVDLGSGWYRYEEGEQSYTNYTMTYGGDFKLSKNILLNFALRTELTSGLKFRSFLPIANIVCLMK